MPAKTQAKAAESNAREKSGEATAPTGRVVRFRQAFYDNEYGRFDKGEVWRVPDGVVLPKRDIEYIEGAPAGEETTELEEDEKVLKKPDPAAAARKKK